MAEFDEDDLRPFSSMSRPRTSAQVRGASALPRGDVFDQFGDDGGAATPRPQTGLRPKTGYRQSMSRVGTAAGGRVRTVRS